ncbi:unnamed protein product [Adineta steineri]|uniref:Uncharacterized protein n=1 Tax=Adineta steineri TaxID=433720 RepID=A0A816D7K7_9BILA|nr:unnamed protein product [Adineta steineri]CAF1632178.1 unnamed protein product [Adineta steineri]
MFIIHFITILLITVINCDQSTNMLDQDDIFPVNITMKNFETIKKDQNMYIQYKIPDEELFIIGFFPLINLTITHHLLTFTCSIPYSNESFSVGFAVGRNTPHKYIIINIHYLFIGKRDNFGLQLFMTRKPTTRSDEMCKIYVMYAYIPKNTTSNQETIDQQSPFPVCWDNQVSSMIDLIPADSVIPPPISKDHHIRMHGSKLSSTNFLYNGESLMIDDTEMFASPDMLKLAITRRFSFNHEILVVLWIILVTILILFLMICCIIHICLNKNAVDVNNNDTTIVSIFANWMNPEKKLIRLESDVDKDDSSSSLIANDDTIINMESKLTTIIINDKNSAVIF